MTNPLDNPLNSRSLTPKRVSTPDGAPLPVNETPEGLRPLHIKDLISAIKGLNTNKTLPYVVVPYTLGTAVDISSVPGWTPEYKWMTIIYNALYVLWSNAPNVGYLNAAGFYFVAGTQLPVKRGDQVYASSSSLPCLVIFSTQPFTLGEVSGTLGILDYQNLRLMVPFTSSGSGPPATGIWNVAIKGTTTGTAITINTNVVVAAASVVAGQIYILKYPVSSAVAYTVAGGTIVDGVIATG